MDGEIRLLERTARATNNPDDIERLQIARDRLGPTIQDAEYLRRYLSICEQYIAGQVSIYQADANERDYLQDFNDNWSNVTEAERAYHEDTGEALIGSPEKPESGPGLIQVLNEEYKFLIGKVSLRTSILANAHANSDYDGFMQSRVC